VCSGKVCGEGESSAGAGAPTSHWKGMNGNCEITPESKSEVVRCAVCEEPSQGTVWWWSVPEGRVRQV